MRERVKINDTGGTLQRYSNTQASLLFTIIPYLEFCLIVRVCFMSCHLVRGSTQRFIESSEVLTIVLLGNAVSFRES